MPESNTPNPEPNGAPGARARPSAEEEVSLLDIALVVVRNRYLILKVAAAVAVLGLFYAVAVPAEYTSSARLIRESSEGAGRISGGLSMLRGLGINIGQASSGLSPSLYPEILQGRRVQLAVVRDTFYFADEDTTYSFVDYANEPPGLVETVSNRVKRYTLRLPDVLAGMLENKTPSRPPPAMPGPDTTSTDEGGAAQMVSYPTPEEERAIGMVGGLVTATVEPGTGLMNVSATTGSAQLSTALVNSFTEHLSDRVRTIRTEKARQNLAFVRERFAEAEQELRAAEEALAQFMDRNSGIQSAQLRTQQERLQRQVSFKEQLYSELQAQVTQAELDVQRSEPVLSVMERAAPPLSPSAPNRPLILLASLFMGLVFGVMAAFVKAFFENQSEDTEEKEKLEEIKSALVPRRLMKR